jgi:transcriptional regulator GlxA family with amidase domain
VTTRAGFTRLSRFAAYYRQTFGDQPREQLA